MKKQALLFALVLLLGLTTTACITSYQSDVKIGKDFDPMQRAEIQVNKSTPADVEELLGRPYRKYRKDEKEYFEYYFERTKTDEERLAFILEGKKREDHVFKMLVIEFTAGVVSSAPDYTRNYNQHR